ncbi:related to Cell division cycle protein 123 [Hanseniaspora guilliermondii]|uniref:Related to Cell division cycle protein 123 n=1 Tax=Hanseniaspora guilliermondii TaxID=56406 RepID=A0A1L0FGD8_9ASCO|nr:related to Cell division cycle protein 123 [Hanseniaspora guilliermondii]
MTTDFHAFSDDKFPALTKNHIDSCKYTNWYEKLQNKSLEKYTIKSHILKNLPQTFILFLLEDGIKLKTNTENTFYDDNQDFSDWSSSDNDTSTDEDSIKFIDPKNEFPEVEDFINDCFNTKSQKLTPRLNWSAPKDAVWILPYNNTMLTYTSEDVYLMLKSSNYIMHDLLYPYDDLKEKCETEKVNYDLILREWIENFNPSLEFRVFVMHGKIIGISQRDIRTEYIYLHEIKDEIRSTVDNFFEEIFIKNYFEECSIEEQNLVLDLYVDIKTQNLKVIDINPFTRSTEPLLFTWNELLTQEPHKKMYEFRLGENNTKMSSRDHSENQVPLEIFDASLDPEKLRELTYEWNRLLNKQLKEDDA